MNVILEGLFFNGSGFAEDNRMLLQCLNYAGIPTKIIPKDSPTSNLNMDQDLGSFIFSPEHNQPYEGDIYICNIMAGAIRYNPNFKVNIARTMFETDRLPTEWVNELNRFDEIWVASKFNLDSFKYSGVSRPIHVVPSIIDYSRFTNTGPTYPLAFKNQFVFLSIFDWQQRKGYSILLEAYLNEFTQEDNVRLLIKTYSLSNNVDPIAEIDSYIRLHIIGNSGTSPIYVINSTLTDSELIQLYRAADAFVLPTRGEGWGRPFFESMAMGIPTLGTNWGGQTEFMTDKNSFPIEIDSLEIIENSEFPIFNGHKWAKPSLNDLRKKMRYVYEHYIDALRKGKIAQDDLRNRFNVKRSSEIIIQRLQNYSNSAR